MALFLLLFLTTVCGFNIFNWWKFRVAFLPTSFWGGALLLVVFLGLAVMPLSLRFFYRGHGNAPGWLEQVSWIWLAWSFWLSSIFLALEAWNLAAWSVWSYQAGRLGAVASQLRCWALSPAATAWLAIALVALATCWGMAEARAVAVTKLTVPAKGLPAEKDGFRLLLISDLHIGSSLSQARLRKIVALVNEQQPDIILSAGDLLDGAGDRERQMVELLQEMQAKQGKFACVGNHDVYAGIDNARKLHAQAGFQLLEDQSMAVNDWLWLAAINDPAMNRQANQNNRQPTITWNDLRPTTAENYFTVLMKHQPEPETDATSGAASDNQQMFNLQVSGHTHKGQIFPFYFLVRMQHRWATGRLHKLSNESFFYISPGTGTWGPPFRVLARPEVTLITLQHHKKST